MYQPAGKPPGGTCIDPSARRPRAIKAESTPIEAICRRTGEDLARYEALTARDDLELGTGGVDPRTRLVDETGGATAAPL